VNQILGDWRFQLSGGMETTGRWREVGARGIEGGRVRLRVDRPWESSTSSLQVGLVVGDGDMYFGLAPGTAEAVEGHLQLLHKTDNIKAQVSLSIFDGSFFIDLPLYFGDSKLGDMPDILEFFAANLDTEFQANFSLWEGNLWILGGNYRWLTVLSDSNDPSTVNQHRVGLFFHFEQKFGEDLTCIAGIRFDYNTITPFAASPRVAAVYRLAEDHYLRLSFGQAFRKPSFFYTSTHLVGVKPAAGFEAIDDLFRRSIGNEDLDNEVLSSFELGYVSQFLEKRLQLDGNVFFNLYRNIVNFQMDIELDEFGMPDLQNSWMGWQNKGQEVDTLGATVSATYRLRGALHLSGSYTFRYSWYISDPAVDAPSGVHKKGDRVPWEPAHLAKLSVMYIPEKGLRLGAAVYGRSSSQEDKPVGGGLFDETVTITNPAHAFFSAFVAWRLPVGAGWVDFGVRAYNVLNIPFRDLPAVARPDGTELGGHLIGRRVFFYLRGSI
jgi:outer membrane receptor protein involved in Fe transport